MRVADTYIFFYNTKLSFSQIPDIIHRFLDSCDLKYHRLCYYFEDLLCYKSLSDDPEAEYQYKLKHNGCVKMLKDCPDLGPLQTQQDADGEFSWCFLSNYNGDSFPEEKLLPLMKKIDRYYGCSDYSLFYTDIDFFGRIIQSHESKDGVEEGVPGIAVYRTPYDTSNNQITLTVCPLEDDHLIDTGQYYEKLKALLPKMRSYHEFRIILSDEEQKEVDECNRKAIQPLKRCKNFFTSIRPAKSAGNNQTETDNIAKVIKQLAEAHGFDYGRNGSCYTASKKAASGAYLHIELNASKTEYGPWYAVSYQGLGFKHLLNDNEDHIFLPDSKAVIISHVRNLFDHMDEFEKDYLPALDSCYKETPKWFVPQRYFDREYR